MNNTVAAMMRWTADVSRERVCPECGKTLPGNAKICKQCGKFVG